MDMIPIRREQFIAIGYDPLIKELEVEFEVGMYTCTDTPIHVYNALKNAHSKTFFYNRHIKKYSWRVGY